MSKHTAPGWSAYNEMQADTYRLKEKIYILEARLAHLLKSNTIHLFDEKDPKTQQYKRDIRRLDTYGVDKKVLEHEQTIDEWDALPSSTLREQAVQGCAKIQPTPRPCEIYGKPAVFHCWVNGEEVLLHFDVMLEWENYKGILEEFKEHGLVRPICHTETIRNTFALVEYADGTVDKVEPENVKFTDRRAVE